MRYSKEGLKTATCLLSVLAIQTMTMASASAQRADTLSQWHLDKNSRMGAPIQRQIAGLSKTEVIAKLGKPDADAPPFNMAQVFQSGPKPETIYYTAPKASIPWFVVAVEFAKNGSESRSYITAQNPYWIGLWTIFAIAAAVYSLTRRRHELSNTLNEFSQSSSNNYPGSASV